jgi:hypothetical protein
MVVSAEKKLMDVLDISPLFFDIVFELVQAFVMTYNEIFQALAVEGDVLLLMTFLDPTHHTAPSQPP